MSWVLSMPSLVPCLPQLVAKHCMCGPSDLVSLCIRLYARLSVSAAAAAAAAVVAGVAVVVGENPD